MPAVKSVTFDRDAWARTHALRHLDIDASVLEVFYLPKNAPPDEVRLLEVNDMVAALTPLEPFNYGIDRDGEDGHALVVLDVTPGQWQAVRDGQLALPPGWSLDGAVSFAR